MPLGNAQSKVASPTPRNIDTARTQALSLVSWNIDAFSLWPSHVPNSSSAISSRVRNLRTLISSKEATPDIRGFLLDDARVRAAFLVTDAEGKTSFEAWLLRRWHCRPVRACLRPRFAEGDGRGTERVHARVCRPRGLPSKFGRDALCVDIIPPTARDTFFRLINVHRASLGDALHYRAGVSAIGNRTQSFVPAF